MPRETVSINSIAAPHMLASAIVASTDSEPLILTNGDDQIVIRSGRAFTELRFPNASHITIQRPDVDLHAGVTSADVSWSSSSSQGSDATLTAKLLVLADSVRLTLNEWLEDDLLEYLKEQV